MRVNDLVRFIKERENARKRKEAGKRPFTKDGIIAKYRFCNVHREDDRVTRWLRANWYPYFAGNKDIWFAAVIARLLNQPESLMAIRGLIIPWQPKIFTSILQRRAADKQKNFNAAYIVSTNGVAMDKVEYLVTRVLGPLWDERKQFHKEVNTLASLHGMLTQFDGMGSFIAAQVVADLKYIEPWKSAPDWWTFAASGPGSRRGLNRWRGYAPESAYREDEWRGDLEGLREDVNKALAKAGWEPLHAQDLQNCLCEFDKYERARLGEGTPKQIYKEREDG